MSKSRRRKPQGFSAPGLRTLSDLMMSADRVPPSHRRRYLNYLSNKLVIWAAITGAIAGFLAFGVLGAMIGFAAGLVLTGRVMMKNRFYRK